MAQPISSKSPSRTLSLYGRISIWLALLFITIGLAIQSVQINLFTQTNLDNSFSQSMAQQMAHSLNARMKETQRLQQMLSAHPLTLQALQNHDRIWPESIKPVLFGAMEIRLINTQSATDLHQEYGFAVQDLVQRTLQGADMDFEIVRRKPNTLFYWATPVRDAKSQILGVLLVQYGDAWLAQFRQATHSEHGQVVVTHAIGNATPIELFHTGEAPQRAGTAVTLPIGKHWFLTFTPKREHSELLLLPMITPWVIALTATLLGLFLVLMLQRRDIRRNQLSLLNYVRNLNDNSEEMPHFSLRLFHELAEQMRHVKQSRRLHVDFVAPTKREAIDVPLEQPRRAPIAPHPLAPDAMEVIDFDDSKENNPS